MDQQSSNPLQIVVASSDADAAILEQPLLAGWEEPRRNAEREKRRTLLRSRSSPAHKDVGSVPPPQVARSYKEKNLLPFAEKGGAPAILVTALTSLLLYLAAGIALFYFTSSNLQGHKTRTMVDALYFCIVTMTTVGYGDLVPTGTAAKLVTCIYLLLGFGLVGILLTSAASHLVRRQEDFLMQAMQKKASATSLPKHSPVSWKVTVTGILVLAVLTVGVLVLITVEHKSLVDSIYFVFVTATTLGYGDETFRTWQGRLFGSVWILLSTLLLAQFFLALAEMRTESRQQALATWVLTRKTTIFDLEAADLDNDGKVRACEFVVYKLKELGKIDESDVVPILKEFRDLDVDNSGTLSVADLQAKE